MRRSSQDTWSASAGSIRKKRILFGPFLLYAALEQIGVECNRPQAGGRKSCICSVRMAADQCPAVVIVVLPAVFRPGFGNIRRHDQRIVSASDEGRERRAEIGRLRRYRDREIASRSSPFPHKDYFRERNSLGGATRNPFEHPTQVLRVLEAQAVGNLARRLIGRQQRFFGPFDRNLF